MATMMLTAKKMARVFGTAALIALAIGPAILSGCAARQNEVPAVLKSDEISQMNEQLLAAAQLNADPSDYLLGSGDLLQVKVFETEDLDAKVRVSSRGYVTLPLLGAVPVKGLSAREAEEKIEELYRARYIKDPHVSVFVEEHFSQRVTLVGEFKNPGTYDYPTKQRLLDVLALGGGLSDKAGQVVQIRRSGNTTGDSGVFFVDLDQVIRQAKTELNIEINGGDVIFVPEAGMFFVDGAVRKPGVYYIKHKTTIQEALLAAGGLAPYADKSKATLVRFMDGKRQIMELDLSKAEVSDSEIKDRDVLVADSSLYGKIVHGLGINLGPLGFGLGYKSPEQ
jgi:polysaccharide export outer membrane protein